MAAGGFSRLGAGLEDEEEAEYERALAGACKLYQAAEAKYTTGHVTAEVLQQLKDAEAAMAPIAQAGLVCMPEHALMPLLKGRLMQAAILKELPEYPDRWPEVRALVESVLQFDHCNIQARRLRALSLMHHYNLPTEARHEMQRAVHFAQNCGDASQAQLLEAEMQRELHGGVAGDGTSALTSTAELGEQAQDGQGAAVELPNLPAAEPGSNAPAGKDVALAPRDSPAPARPAVQRGFLNKGCKKEANRVVGAKRLAAGPDTTDGQLQPEPTPGMPTAPLDLQAPEKLAEVQRQLQELQEQQRLDRQRVAQWQTQLQQAVVAVGSDVEGLLAEEPVWEGGGGSCLWGLRTSASQLAEELQAGRTWAEAEHRRYSEFSTELATLRELAVRELRERREASDQQLSSVRELACRMDSLRAAARALRKRTGRSAPPGALPTQDGQDLQHLAEDVAGFRALPAAVKLAALADDAAVLRLMALSFVLGVLLALGGLVEAFSIFGCRLVSAA